MIPEDEGYPLAQFRKTYFEECAELLDSLQANLESLSDSVGDHETLHAIFRSVHSIKGGAGAFGFSSLVAFSHVYESLLDGMREEKISATPDVMQLLLQASDALEDIVNAARVDRSLPDDFAADIVTTMQEVLQGASEAPAEPAPATAGASDVQAAGVWRYRIHFAPHSEMLQRANEPLRIIRHLRKLGSLQVEANSSDLPSLELIDPETAYLKWIFVLETSARQTSVREVFEFVEDDCDLEIDVETEPASPGVELDYAEAPNSVAALSRSATAPAPSALPAPSGPTASLSSSSIRVDVERVDRLVNLVGELVITQAMLTEQGAMLPADQHPALIQGIEALAQSARELQESVMAIRAQPVKSVFARMPRVVRDLAAVLDKDVRIITSGEMTEIDKTVIEQLNDPLTHMIRNALDHGIESPDERATAGKPRQGTVHLSAARRSGRIVIEVVDDGRGINREKVLARARARGFVAPGAVLDDEEIDNLIFLPSFSTADVISNVSGRGVGMDVVKRNVQALGGRISVQSRFGAGSRFTLSLPLTLAVEDGMIVSVGRETFIIPLTAIVESLRPRPADIHSVVGRRQVLALRGEYLPLMHLHQCFSIEGAVTDPCRGIVIIAQSENAGRIGIVVDELLGQQQVVVKSLEANYEAVDGISGATILGNGRVALILDVARLRDCDRKSSENRFVGPPNSSAGYQEDVHHAA